MASVLYLMPRYITFLAPTLILTGILGIIYVDIPDKTRELIIYHNLRLPKSEKLFSMYRILSIVFHVALIGVPLYAMRLQSLRFSGRLLPSLQNFVIVPLLVFRCMRYASDLVMFARFIGFKYFPCIFHMISFIRRYLPPPIIPYSVRIQYLIGVKGCVPPPKISRDKPEPLPEIIYLPEGSDSDSDSDSEVAQIQKGTQPYSV